MSKGRFADEPLHGFIANDPWGKNPSEWLQNATWSFVKCETCGQKFHRRILDETWNRVYYSEWMSSDAIAEYKRRNGQTGFRHEFGTSQNWIEHALRIERITRPVRGEAAPRLLDFGCGEGAFLNVCATLGFKGVGVEFSAARESTRQINFLPSLEKVTEAHDAGTFDAVTLFQVLEHLSEPLKTLKDLNPLMKTGGVLVLETPNCVDVTSIQTHRDFLLIDPLGHINAFDPKSLEEIARQAGFRKVKRQPVQVSADPGRIAKREIRRLVEPLLRPYTNLIFVKA